MLSLIKKLLKKQAFLEMVKFMIVGATNFSLDGGIYFFFTRFLQLSPLFSRIISTSVALSSGFFFNLKWTFRYKEKINLKIVFRYLLINVTGLLINNGLFTFMIVYLKFFDLYALPVATVIAFLWNFSLSKFYVFRKRD